MYLILKGGRYSKMSVKTLKEIEQEILKKVDVFKATRTTYHEAQRLLEEAQRLLEEAVQAYQKERERLQREAWVKENKGWCQSCNKFYPQESIRLLYTEGQERHGLRKRVRAFCEGCTEVILSRPRGGEEEFQCYKAKQEKDGFIIFVSGQWVPLPDPEHTQIEIKRGYIPEGEYRFGKRIGCSGWPSLHLKIEEREIL